MEIRNLMIEVTRKCNIMCEHCLRGEPMNKNISKVYIDQLLIQVDSISTVTFTGGEPTLNVLIMNYFLNRVKELNIPISSFYIATNGVKITEEFILFCLKMYSYCDEKEFCSVDVSNDIYHSYECDYDISLLSGLSFFKFKFEKNNFDYYRSAI